jgi:hypothetical protein
LGSLLRTGFLTDLSPEGIVTYCVTGTAVEAIWWFETVYFPNPLLVHFPNPLLVHFPNPLLVHFPNSPRAVYDSV